MRLLTPCPTCAKPLELKSECKLGTETLRTYKCGHAFVETEPLGETIDGIELDDCKSLNGLKEAFDFQKEGVRFGIKSGFNCLIADPMGLGKTIQALLIARNSNFKRILVLCKASCTYQWFEESKEWYATGLWSAHIIQGTKNFIVPGFQVYIMSMDTLRGYMQDKKKHAEFASIGFDLVIVDECHSFKNPDSARSQALVAFLSGISHTEVERVVTFNCPMCRETWKHTATIQINLRDNKSQARMSVRSDCPKCQAVCVQQAAKDVLESDREKRVGLILLSGTPIKNRAEEYFVPLNLLRPQAFTSVAQFRRNWLEQDPYDGKYKRFKPYRFDEFEYETRNFIIRREKNKVLSLPPFRRAFETIFIEDPKVKLAYNKELANLAAIQGAKPKFTWFDVQESLMSLRRITGMAKVPFALEYVDTFLDTVEDEKILIGIHHEAVRDALFYGLTERGFKPFKLSGEDSAEKKNQIVQEFNRSPARRVMIVNMIAGGVGLNLQVANNILGLERLWNAAEEEQFEGRTHRQGQVLPVLAEWMNAKGTLDELYFHPMIEEKRDICTETLDHWDIQGNPEALRDLVDKTVANRL